MTMGVAHSVFSNQLACCDDQPFHQFFVHHHHVVAVGVADMHRMQDVQAITHCCLL